MRRALGVYRELRGRGLRAVRQGYRREDGRPLPRRDAVVARRAVLRFPVQYVGGPFRRNDPLRDRGRRTLRAEVPRHPRGIRVRRLQRARHVLQEVYVGQRAEPEAETHRRRVAHPPRDRRRPESRPHPRTQAHRRRSRAQETRRGRGSPPEDGAGRGGAPRTRSRRSPRTRAEGSRSRSHRRDAEQVRRGRGATSRSRGGGGERRDRSRAREGDRGDRRGKIRKTA